MTESLENTSEFMQSEDTQEQLLTPGQILLKERAARNLSLDAVAQQLLLSKQLINDIENDVTSDIYARVAPVYIKGYLRSYAKLFDIGEKQIFTAFDNFRKAATIQDQALPNSFSHEELQSLQRRSSKTLNNLSRRRVGIIVIAVLAIIISIFLISLTYNRTIPNVNKVENMQNAGKPAEQSAHNLTAQPARADGGLESNFNIENSDMVENN